MLEHYTPPYDATAVARLKAAGVLLAGKCNCDAFAMGSTTEGSDYHVSSPAMELAERVECTRTRACSHTRTCKPVEHTCACTHMHAFTSLQAAQ